MELRVKEEKPEHFTLILPPADEEEEETLDEFQEKVVVNAEDKNEFAYFEIYELNADICEDIGDDPAKTEMQLVDENVFKEPLPKVFAKLNRKASSKKKKIVTKARVQHAKIDERHRYQCDKCGWFYMRSSILRHLQSCGPNTKLNKTSAGFKKAVQKNERFPCYICKMNFCHKSEMTEHVMSHQDKPKLRVPCPTEYEFDESKKFVCNQCPWRFSAEKQLQFHLVNVHSDEKPYECDFPSCGKSFKARNALKDHKNSVHVTVRPHVCPKCDKRFKIVHHLKEHILRMHEKPKERTFTCEFCPNKFFNNLDVRVHEKRSHAKL